MASPRSCLSWLSSSQESDPTIGPPNPWFDFYNRLPPSPTSIIETDPNWGRSTTTKDEEIQAMFDLQIDLQDLTWRRTCSLLQMMNLWMMLIWFLIMIFEAHFLVWIHLSSMTNDDFVYVFSWYACLCC